MVNLLMMVNKPEDRFAPVSLTQTISMLRARVRRDIKKRISVKNRGGAFFVDEE
jgi:hypothetical protein